MVPFCCKLNDVLHSNTAVRAVHAMFCRLLGGHLEDARQGLGFRVKLACMERAVKPSAPHGQAADCVTPA